MCDPPSAGMPGVMSDKFSVPDIPTITSSPNGSIDEASYKTNGESRENALPVGGDDIINKLFGNSANSPGLSRTSSVLSDNSTASFDQISDTMAKMVDGFLAGGNNNGVRRRPGLTRQSSGTSSTKELSVPESPLRRKVFSLIGGASSPPNGDSALVDSTVSSRRNSFEKATSADEGLNSNQSSLDGLLNLAQGVVGSLIQDFSVMDPPTENECDVLQPDQNTISVKYTTDILTRFDDNNEVMLAVADAFLTEYFRLTLWVRPFQTFLIFVVLLHSIWREYMLLLFMAFLIFGFTYTLLISRGWMSPDPLYETLVSLSKRRRNKAGKISHLLANINSTLLKAGKAFNMVSDCFEKIACLWTWQKPLVTLVVYACICVATAATLILPYDLTFKLTATGIIVKLFVADFIFSRFPLVRAKYDPIYVLWCALPTSNDLAKEQKVSSKRSVKSARGSARNSGTSTPRSGAASSILAPSSLNEKTAGIWLSSTFGVSKTERFRSGWEQGVQCTLVKADLPLTSSFKSGRLFLTTKFILFMRSKTNISKNIVIPIQNLIRVDKGKASSWLSHPGCEASSQGATVVIHAQNDVTCTLGAIPNFEEVYSELCSLVPLSLD